MATVAAIENRVIGNYISQEASFVITSPSGTSEAITLPGVFSITGIKSFVALESNGKSTGYDAVLTWSGNVLTIADGAGAASDGYDHSDAANIYVTVFCTRPI